MHSLFGTRSWENMISARKRIHLTPYLSPPIKINSSSMKHVNVRPKSLQFVEENIDKTIQRITTGRGFLDPTQEAQKKTKIDK